MIRTIVRLASSRTTATIHMANPHGYPEARRTDFSEVIHGKDRPDPYRWMEESSDELKSWINDQNKLSDAYTDKFKEKENLYKKLKERYDFEKHGIPWKEGNKWYYFFNTGIQNRSVLYTKNDIFDEKEKATVLIDPNTMNAEGTASLGSMDFSTSGKYLAYIIKEKGSDWGSIHVKDCETGEDLKDYTEWVKHSGVSWSHDEKGYFYSGYEKQEGLVDKGTETTEATNQRLCYHRLGTPQSDDVVIYHDASDPKLMYSGYSTEDGEAIIVSFSKACAGNGIWVILMSDLDLTNYNQSTQKIRKLIDHQKFEYDFVDKVGSKLYFKTSDDAPNSRVVCYDLSTEKWETVVPEEKDVLETCTTGYGGVVYLGYSRDVKDIIFRTTFEDASKREQLDIEIGSIGICVSTKYPEVFYAVTSFAFAKRIYTFKEPNYKEPKLWYESKVPDHDSSQIESKQVFFTSKDGTKVPMFLVYKKGLKLDGNNPALLYVYGGFKISMGIYFSSSRLSFINNFGGVYVMVNARGGLEYGEDWWKGGSLFNKQNTFDDTIGAAKWLHENKYTNPSKLALQGGSNGGLVVAACANQAPEVFGAVIAEVPVMDITRFHKFTIGSSWKSDWGDPDVEKDFDYIMTYSPLHNIDPSKKYPTFICRTADHDDRVVPLHTYKFVAAAQHLLKDHQNPVFASVDVNSGHDGKPTEKVLRELADVYSFIAVATNSKWIP
eukprot:TRINITY_DN1946_c0_g1_i1.p1 TRINITY_DN1946_c0_g1~~TRINITY_DN1946_c0_g1_i1.p1  ORF type:complete len:719 (+),score=149.01 TRINITY_DN1946_c0_g1_i1:124-2280(+)